MQILTNLQERILEYSPKLLMGVLIFLVSWLIAGVLGKIIVRLGNKLGGSKKDVVHLGASICRGTILTIGVITALGTIGVNVSALVAGLGLTGFALGFALRDALSNLLSGVLILFYQPFMNGDWISVAGCEGQVVETNLRYTLIKNNKDTYLIPNSTLFSNIVRVSEKT